jgi:hypothetical protein
MNRFDEMVYFVEMYCKHYQKVGDQFLYDLAWQAVPIQYFLSLYDLMIVDSNVPPIEALPAEKKWHLYEEAKRVSQNQDKAHIVKVTKAIYALGLVNEQFS